MNVDMVQLNKVLDDIAEDKRYRLQQLGDMKIKAGNALELLGGAMTAPPGSDGRKRLLETSDKLFDEVVTEFKAFRDSLSGNVP